LSGGYHLDVKGVRIALFLALSMILLESGARGDYAPLAAY
jgi:hypothetical protein